MDKTSTGGMLPQNMTVKDFMISVLNALSLGVIIAVLPAAVFSQVVAAFPDNAMAQQVNVMITVVQSLLPVFTAIIAGNLFKLNMGDAGAMALAVFVTSGVITVNKTEEGKAFFTLAGTGALLNIVLVTIIAYFAVKLSNKILGQFKIILGPALVLVGAGFIGYQTLPLMVSIQDAVGAGIKAATDFTPVVMGIVLGASFAFLITSPLSSVAIAMAVGVSGVGAGSANLGAAAIGMTLAIMGARVNSLGVILAHIIGTPKVSMVNLLTKPKLYLPGLLAGGIMGGIGALLDIKGTPFSAGFGSAGLIGPLTALSSGVHWMVAVGIYTVGTFAVGYGMYFLFVKVLKMMVPEDFKLELD